MCTCSANMVNTLYCQRQSALMNMGSSEERDFCAAHTQPKEFWVFAVYDYVKTTMLTAPVRFNAHVQLRKKSLWCHE